MRKIRRLMHLYGTAAHAEEVVAHEEEVAALADDTAPHAVATRAVEAETHVAELTRSLELLGSIHGKTTTTKRLALMCVTTSLMKGLLLILLDGNGGSGW